MFESMYDTRRYEREPFGDNWVFIGNSLPSHQETLIAQYPKTCEDGQAVDVYCYAAPARFYTLVVHAGDDSIGQNQDGYEIKTGSSQEKLAASIATAIASGMLVFYPL